MSVYRWANRQGHRLMHKSAASEEGQVRRAALTYALMFMCLVLGACSQENNVTTPALPLTGRQAYLLGKRN